jgi:molybdopterin molybdotransferase
MVTFALFGVPLIRKMQGDRAPHATPWRAILTHDHARAPGRLEFARAVVGGGEVTLVRHQASGAALGLASANALALIPPDVTQLRRGDALNVIAFSELGL